ncbi:MAG: hypothetical protein ACLFN9_08020 [Desulfococcaceae bacterium]
MDFEIIGAIREIEPIATGRNIRVLSRLKKQYGGENWRKLKGFAAVRFPDGSVQVAEVHWYEAHGIGKKEIKLKFPPKDSP